MLTKLKNDCSVYPWPTVERQAQFMASDDPMEQVADRQNRVPGFSSNALGQAHVLLIGAGGLGGEIATGLVRKGIGRLDVCDPDTVEISNLNRQYFFATDLYQPKAFCLARNAAANGFLGSQVVGHYTAFEPASAPLLLDNAGAVIVGTDNNVSRNKAALFCRLKHIPAIFTAVSETADYA